METEYDIKNWSDRVAAIAVDSLVDAGLISRADFAEATAIVAEEIRIRLVIGDCPVLGGALGDE